MVTVAAITALDAIDVMVAFVVLVAWVAAGVAGERDFKVRISLFPPSISLEVKTPPDRGRPGGRP